MGRIRKKDAWLPSRVYRGKSAYEWHPKSGGCVRLCGLGATQETRAPSAIIFGKRRKNIRKALGMETKRA